jgi:hypothetical protein
MNECDIIEKRKESIDIKNTCKNNDKHSDKQILVNIGYLNKYIEALIDNIDKNKLPSEKINIIFDGGAINGVIGIGSALYIDKLRKNKYLKIDKISGCSVGSLIALWFYHKCPEMIFYYLDTFFSYYKNHKNLSTFHDFVNCFVNDLIDTDDVSYLNGKLFINCYDTKKHKQKVTSKFKNRQHLIHCILRSCHIPYIINKCYSYQERYIDGIVPHYFKNESNILIKLISFKNILGIFKIKNENNIYIRLLKGVVDVNDFFINGETTMHHTYIKPQYFCIKTELYIRKLYALFIFDCIKWLMIFKDNIPVCIRETLLYNLTVNLFHTKVVPSLQNYLI